MPVVFVIVLVSTASVVSSSKHHALLQFTDSAVTSVVVGRSSSFESSSLRMDRAVMAMMQ